MSGDGLRSSVLHACFGRLWERNAGSPRHRSVVLAVVLLGTEVACTEAPGLPAAAASPADLGGGGAGATDVGPDGGRSDGGSADLGGADAELRDALDPPDHGVLDAEPGDADPPDQGAADAEPSDAAGPSDGGAEDLGAADGGLGDLGWSDAGSADQGFGDTGPDDGGIADQGSSGPQDGGPRDLGSGDLGFLDQGPGDVGPGDQGPTDAEPGDLGPTDAERTDLAPGWPDLGASDLGRPDLGDLGASDLGRPDLGDLGASDLGRPDLGDLGASDLGRPDLGDLGASDLGRPELGRPDLGDLGASDLGRSDLGPSDLGDLGGSDLGETDLGGADLGPGDVGVPDAAPADVGYVNTGPRPCTARGWCWDNPIPQFGNWKGVWTDGTERWLVGRNGVAVRFDGQRWRRIPTGTTEDLEAVWGGVASDVWVVGGRDVILRWDGTALTRVSPPISQPGPVAVHGTSTSNVWIIGDRALHFDGRRLVYDAGALGLNDVFVRTASDAYGVDDGGRILRWDGAAWSAMTSGTLDDLNAVFGAGSEVWAAGERGTVRRFDGARWSAGPSIGSNFETTDLWMSGTSDVYAVTEWVGPLVRYDGSRWIVPFPRGDRPLSAVYGSAAGDVQVAGVAGFWGRFDGVAWEDGNAQRPLHAIARTSTGAGAELWAAGLDDVLMRRGPSGWTRVRGTTRGDHTWGVFTGGGVSWLLGEGGKILAWNGVAFSRISSFTSSRLRDAWGTGPNAMWAVGDGGNQAFFDGLSWSRPSPGTTVDLRGTWGSRPNDVWAVGGQAVITRWDGTRLSITQVGSRSRIYEDIDGRSATDVWVVGHQANGQARDGVVLHWDGSSWTTVHTVPFAELRAVLVVGPQEIWVGSDLGTILRWDGTMWTTDYEHPDLIDITSLWRDGSGRIWAATEGGGVLFKDP